MVIAGLDDTSVMVSREAMGRRLRSRPPIMPGGIDVKEETADDCVHTAVSAPPVGHGELPDHELSNAAGVETQPRRLSCRQPTWRPLRTE